MTILGRTLDRPSRDVLRHIQHVEGATATALRIFFNPEEFDYVIFRAYDIASLSNPSSQGDLLVSSNGGTFESSANTYQWTAAGNASATVWQCFSSTNDNGFDITNTLGNATAATQVVSEFVAIAWNPTATNKPVVSWEHNYTNSASTPQQRIGRGSFATGPIKGLSFEFNGVTFNGKADLYGAKFSR